MPTIRDGSAADVQGMDRSLRRGCAFASARMVRMFWQGVGGGEGQRDRARLVQICGSGIQVGLPGGQLLKLRSDLLDHGRDGLFPVDDPSRVRGRDS